MLPFCICFALLSDFFTFGTAVVSLFLLARCLVFPVLVWQDPEMRREFRLARGRTLWPHSERSPLQSRAPDRPYNCTRDGRPNSAMRSRSLHVTISQILGPSTTLKSPQAEVSNLQNLWLSWTIITAVSSCLIPSSHDNNNAEHATRKENLRKKSSLLGQMKCLDPFPFPFLGHCWRSALLAVFRLIEWCH